MKKALLFVTLLAVFAIPANAAPYATDDFSAYNIGSNPVGQNGGAGFGGAWSLSTYDGGTGSASIVSGLTLSGVSTSGNALQITSSGGGASLDRTFGNAVPSNGNLWGSFLFSQQAIVNNNGYGQDASVTGTKFTIGGDGNRQYFASPVDDSPYSSSDYADIGIYKNSNASSSYLGPSANLTLNQTYFVVYDFSNIGYGAYTSNTTTEDMWVLNQANLNAIDGNFTTASLNANNVLDLSYSTGPGGETYGTTTITPTSIFSLVGQAGTVDFGNLKLGSSLVDVASIETVPEPSTWALMAIGIVSLLVIRRQRSSAK